MNQSQSVQVVFYDGVVSKSHLAQIAPLDETSVEVRYGDHLELRRRYAYDDMELIGALGQLQPVIELKDDARIEFQQQLPEWFNLDSKGAYHSIWKLERSPKLIIFSVIFVALFIFGLIKWAVPMASNYIAFQLPENILHKVGNEAELYVNQMTQPSHLAQGQKDQITQQYKNIIAEGRPAKLLFRAGGELGANAVALPNNTIIVTDDLIELAHSDQEILGVLAHEQGHLVERHSLQQGLTSLGLSVLYVAITGDSSDLMTTLPLAMVGAGYSRKFEQEADLYALKLMDRKGIEVSHFANFLQRLNDSTESTKHGAASQTATDSTTKKKTDQEEGAKDDPAYTKIFDIMSSHPATEERIQMVRDFEKQQKLKLQSVQSK